MYIISDPAMAKAKKKVSKAKRRAIKPVEQEYQQNLKMNWVKMVEQRKKKKERLKKQLQREKKKAEGAKATSKKKSSAGGKKK